MQRREKLTVEIGPGMREALARLGQKEERSFCVCPRSLMRCSI
jgi:hypothetical protein